MGKKWFLLLIFSPQGGSCVHFSTWFQFSWEPSQHSRDNRALFLFLSLISLVCQTLIHIKPWLCSSPLSSFHSRRCPLFPHTQTNPSFLFMRSCHILCIVYASSMCVSINGVEWQTERWWCVFVVSAPELSQTKMIQSLVCVPCINGLQWIMFRTINTKGQ